MAPEQLGNQPELIDGRADVYALGSILFYILSHSKPFSNTNSNLATLLKLKRKTSPSLQQWITDNPQTIDIPRALVEVCDKAIAHDPKDRFLNTKQLQEVLQGWF